MNTRSVILNSFKKDISHFGEFHLLLTVKSFDLKAVRERYIQSRKRSKAGSVERRQPTPGGVVAMTISDGEIKQQKILANVTEARGIDIRGDTCVLSSEDKIFLFDSTTDIPKIIENPWFSYIHTVKFNRDGTKLLISSSGLDILFEIALQSNSILWEWLAWENGINKGENPKIGEFFILTRRPEEVEKLKKRGENVLLISDPRAQQLPTALRAAFINSAEYNSQGNILATQFHAGRVIAIDRRTGRFTTIIDGLSRPHGGMEYKNGCLATDTAGGGVFFKNDEELIRYDFTTLPGKSEATKDMEWLQTSHFHNDTIITVDSNRTSFIFFDPDAKKYMAVPFDSNWAVQDFVLLENYKEKLFMKIGKL